MGDCAVDVFAVVIARVDNRAQFRSNCIITSSLSLVESALAQSDRVTIITELQASMQNTWRIHSIPLKGGGKRVLGIKWRKTGALSALATRVVQYAHEVAAAAVVQVNRPRQKKARAR